MTESEKSQCHHIIHLNAVAASGVAAIEVEMVIALGQVFDISVRVNHQLQCATIAPF